MFQDMHLLLSVWYDQTKTSQYVNSLFNHNDRYVKYCCCVHFVLWQVVKYD